MKKSIQLIICSIFFAGLTAKAQEKISVNGTSIFITGTGTAQEEIKPNGKTVTETRTTSEYDAIKVSGFFNVDLVAGKEGKITLKGDEAIISAIIVEVEDNTLKIYVKNNTLYIDRGEKIEVTVPFEKISELSSSGSGNIESKDSIKNDKFLAKLSGSGNFNLIVDSNTLELDLSGSGNINLKGTADNFTAKISGSGDIDTIDFKSKNVDVNVSGSGNSKVNCEKSLTARVLGSGNIRYTGNPVKIEAKVLGSGKISKI